MPQHQSPKPLIASSKKRQMPVDSRASTPSIVSETESASSDIVTVSHFGDLILDVSKDDSREHVLAKVDSSKLKKVSKYFNTLLDPTGHFREGQLIVEQQERLKEVYAKLADVPDEDLPRIVITDIGQTSALKSIKPLVIDFLRILHGYDIQKALRNPPPVNIANIAVLADRFDAKDAVSAWALSKANVMPKIHASLPTYDEEIYRQRLLTCLFLGNELRLATYSSHLELAGSAMWKNDVPASNRALWWDLPRGLEDELQVRRSHILDAVLSLQDYLLASYTSKARQCRLGYDTSPQCDSFQLGEFVKFLTKVGTLRLHGSLADSEEPEIATSDIRNAIKDLRACPSYQLDPNHSHCGPKKLLLAGLDYIEARLGESHIGICYRCWRDPTVDHLWSSAKPQPFFSTPSVSIYQQLAATGACAKIRHHDGARDFFTAVDKSWVTLLYGR